MSKLISFEGPEGSGKTTQAKLLVSKLNQVGIRAIYSKEPGAAFDGAIRNLLLADNKPCTKAELFLFLADRAQHVNQVIKPALDKNIWVVVDRFIDSTIVYQGYARGLMSKLLYNMIYYASDSLVPDKTYLIDVSVEKSLERLQYRSDALKRLAERENIEFLQKIRNGFLEIANVNNSRVTVIDGNQLPSVINELIYQDLTKTLK